MSESLESQIDRIANYIMHNVPGEPSQNEGAIDTAIRLLSTQKDRETAAVRNFAEKVKDYCSKNGKGRHNIDVEQYGLFEYLDTFLKEETGEN